MTTTRPTDLPSYILRHRYDPTRIPARAEGGPVLDRFPVVIPPGFVPSDSDRDGPDVNAKRRLCPGYSDDHKPSFGGGFFAPRGPYLHEATDIMAAEGAHVVAPAMVEVPAMVSMKLDGVVGPFPGAGASRKAGHYLVLRDANGWEWYFSHLRDMPLVRPGEIVEAGSLLGHVGRTGNAARKYPDGSVRGCPHLHARLGLRVGRAVRKYDAEAALRPLWAAGGWVG